MMNFCCKRKSLDKIQDRGTAFTLLVTAQQLHFSSHPDAIYHQPLLQSLSWQYRAERNWPEISERMNYLIKQILLEMENMKNYPK